MALMQLAFKDLESVNSFASDITSRRGGLALMPRSQMMQWASSYGGIPVSVNQSSSRRETWLHGQRPTVYQQDLDYLMKRDPVARAVISKPPRDTWMRMPRAYEPAVDDFFARLVRLGFTRAVINADVSQRRTLPGCAFLYIKAGGAPGNPIDEGGDLWTGFQAVKAGDIDWRETTWNYSDPTLPWGVERLAVVQGDGTRAKIHGSRLIPLCEDLEATKLQEAWPKLAALHDPLWRRLDVEAMQNGAQVDGNPYVLEIDTDLLRAGMGRVKLDPTEADDMMDQVAEVASGETHAFGIMKAIRVRRVGKVDLDNPEWVLRLVAGAVAADSEFTSNMVIVFSRGSEQITDADRNDYGDDIEIRRDLVAWPVLDRAFTLGQVSGFVKKTRPEVPLELKWPSIRRLTQREEAFVLARNAATLREAREARRLPPRHIDELFPKDPESLPEKPIRADERKKRDAEDAAAEKELDGKGAVEG